MTPPIPADLPVVELKSPDGSVAKISLHGGHVLSWKPSGAQEQLYLSPISRFGAGASIRGGVPVIFPQFAEQGPGPRHGIARNRLWQLVQQETGKDDALAVLRLTDDDATRALWPYAFVLELTVRLTAGQLDLELAVENAGDVAFDFQAALHSYWRLQSLTHTVVQGLQGCTYFDQTRGGAEGVQHSSRLELLGQGAVDRVVTGVEGALGFTELGETPARRLGLLLEGFEDAVVWNPGPAHGLPDLPADGWQHMLCLEAAQIQHPVHLPPGEAWVARQTARTM
jgi:glucose-6-phosphate 1-epimerase